MPRRIFFPRIHLHACCFSIAPSTFNPATPRSFYLDQIVVGAGESGNPALFAGFPLSRFVRFVWNDAFDNHVEVLRNHRLFPTRIVSLFLDLCLGI
jgi:hypothetical protein